MDKVLDRGVRATLCSFTLPACLCLEQGSACHRHLHPSLAGEAARLAGHVFTG